MNFRDFSGPFLRPHPAIWRAAFAVSIVYELLLIYILFQVSFYSASNMKMLENSRNFPF